MFSKKATKFDKIFTFDLTICSKCQIDGEDFVNFCGLLRKHEIYIGMSIKIRVKELDIFIDVCELRIFYKPLKNQQDMRSANFSLSSEVTL